MTLARFFATGSGAVSWRIEIEGYPTCFVSHSGMVQTDGDGRAWVHGLKLDGIELSEQVDLVTAKAKGNSITIKIVNPGAGAALFAKTPTAVTYLRSDATKTATSIEVQSTAAFPTSGHIYLNTECIAYSGKDADTFTGATRGVFKSLAQKHYTADGERLRYPEITDHPVALEGRRVRLYGYGAGDSKTGNGTLVWTGVARTDAAFNGIVWSFLADSILSVLDQELGGDLKDPVPIRGIYYPESAPLVVRMSEGQPGSTSDTDGEIALAGFWEDQAAFLVDLNTAIAAEISAQSFNQTDVSAIEWGDSWAIQFITGGVTARWMEFQAISAVDKLTPGFYAKSAPDGRLFTRITPLTTSTTYVYLPDPDECTGAGTVPRSTYGHYGPSADAAAALDASQVTGIDGTHSPYRVYVGGSAAVTTSTGSVSVEWTSTGNSVGAGDGGFEATIDSVDTSERSITTVRATTPYPPPGDRDPYTGAYWSATAADVPVIRQGRDYGVGSLSDFLTALEGETADYVNTGAVPYIRPTIGGVDGDLDIAGSEIDEAAGSTVLGSRRRYSVFAPVSLSELIEHECRLIGVYPCLNSSGQIRFKRLRLPSPGEVAGDEITASLILTDDQVISWERRALGIFNTYRLATQYDPISDEHRGDHFVVRDVAAFGQAPQSRTIEVEPKSVDPVFFEAEDVIKLASRVLGVFGGPYVMVTIDVSMNLFEVEVGDVVSVTWSRWPGSGGTMGVTGKLALVVGKSFIPRKARGQLTLLATDQVIGGYAPASRITSITDGTSGTTGPFSLVLSTDYLPAGGVSADLWTAGDLIRLYKWNSATAGTVLGTVSSAPGANGLIITTDSAWTYAGSDWVVGSRVSTAITAASQRKYAFIAGADFGLDWSGDTDNPPFTFAP